MAFDFSCCFRNDAEIFIANYNDIINRAAGANLRSVGKVINYSYNIEYETKEYKSKITNTSIFASQKKCDELVEQVVDKVNIKLSLECFRADLIAVASSAERTNIAGSVVGTPRSTWAYVSKPSLSAAADEQWVAIPLPYAFDSSATGADAFKVEGYAVAGTPMSWNRDTNATTNATTGAAITTPVVTALTANTEYRVTKSPKTNAIVKLEVLATSIKFIDYALSTSNVVNIKITGKTLDTVIMSQGLKPFDGIIRSVGYNFQDGKFNTFQWNKVSLKASSDFIVLNQGTELGVIELEGIVRSNSELQEKRPDFAPPAGVLVSGYGWVALEG